MPDIKSALQAALLRAPSHVQTVVQKTINEWDDEGEKHFPINISSVNPVQTKPVQTPMPTAKVKGRRVINNVMRETFNCVKANPGKTAKEIGTIMATRGFKKQSVTSTCSQLCQSGQARRENGALYAVVDEYQTIPATPSKKISSLKKQLETLRQVAKGKGIKDLPVQPARPTNTGIASLSTPMPAPAPQAELPKSRPRPASSYVDVFDPKAILDPLTVYQARALYAELKNMFGA